MARPLAWVGRGPGGGGRQVSTILSGSARPGNPLPRRQGDCQMVNPRSSTAPGRVDLSRRPASTYNVAAPWCYIFTTRMSHAPGPDTGPVFGVGDEPSRRHVRLRLDGPRGENPGLSP